MQDSKATSPNCLILDGGMGREIERRGGPFRQPEWSALCLYEDPDLVREVHAAFITAGCHYITTNSYAVVPFHLGTARYQKDGKRLLKLAVDLARQAAADAAAAAGPQNTGTKVLGCIPPICGSYQPNAFDKVVAGPILDDFIEAYRGTVDGVILETIGSVEEAEFYLKGVVTLKCPIMLSFCLSSDPGQVQTPHLLSNKEHTLTDAVQRLAESGYLQQLDVFLVNCCDVRLVADAIKEIKTAVAKVDGLCHHLKVGAYPNAFSVAPPGAANHSLRPVDNNITPEILKQYAATEWAGASVLGGCCGVGPEHIAALASLGEKEKS